MDKAYDAISNFSIITQIELLCWRTDDVAFKNVKNFIASKQTELHRFRSFIQLQIVFERATFDQVQFFSKSKLLVDHVCYES
ncbi:MAG TPA: hypothetical protein PKD85_23935, partial [Saprospiraceae bacterium]|nr:hypothetical protein [Saprospiraceae bacterium]